VLGAVGHRLVGLRLLIGPHGAITDHLCVAEVVGLDQIRRERVAAAMALAPLGVDADPHGLDVTDEAYGRVRDGEQGDAGLGAPGRALGDRGA
jgi:hypothetical protein